MKILQRNFNNYLNKNFSFEYKPKIAVAVSGGPDSMALTFLLKNWAKKNKGSLVALIVDHKIRKDSWIEANIVKNYLRKNKIYTRILPVIHTKITKKNMNEARNNRFHELITFCKKKYILHLFVAHHYDDHVETFLLRKIAGSNFEGLRSLQNKVFNSNVQILRPLLDYRKKEILNYNKNKNIFYVNDPSNSNKNYSRSLIRGFLKTNKNYTKEIEKDLDKVILYYPIYKKMIFQILNLLLLKVNSKKMFIDYEFFLNLQQEIQIKIIEIIYKFLKPKRIFLRYDKTLKILNLLTKQDKVITNLGGMNIEKNPIFIHFNA